MARRRFPGSVGLEWIGAVVLLLSGCTPRHRTAEAAAAPTATSAAVEPAEEDPLTPATELPRDSWESECYRAPVRLEHQTQPEPLSQVELERLKVCPSAQSFFECELGHAETYLLHQRFELAAPILRRLALDPDSGDRGLDAARLYVESLDRLGAHTDPPRPACYSTIPSDVKQVLALYCQDRGGSRGERCGWFRQIDNDVERLAAERLVERADMVADRSSPSSPEARRLYRQGGDRYLALFDRACRGRGPGDPDRYRKCDEVIYMAHKAYRAAGAMDLAEAARASLLDPRNGLSSSPLAEKLKLEQAPSERPP
jgi:hypothetical protein